MKKQLSTTINRCYCIILDQTRRAKLFCQLLTVIFLFNAASVQAQISFSTTAVPSGMEFGLAGTGIVQVADINKDGYPDYLYNTAIGGGITYMQNNGNSSFSTPAINPFSAFTASSPTGLILNTNSNLADFDGDGDIDIWCRVSGASNDVYLKNNNGTYAAAALLPGMEFSNTGTGIVQVADINMDGFPDIIYNSGSGSAIFYLQNNGGTSFSTPSSNPFAAFTASSPANTTFNTTCSFADFDGDGDLDLWVRVLGANNDVYLKNNNGVFAHTAIEPSLEFNPSFGTGAVQVADFNGDGLPDFVYSTATGSSFVYLQNNGGTSFSTPAINPFAAYSSPVAGITLNTSASVADFNKDGDLDLWVRQNGAANDLYATASGIAPVMTLSSPLNGATAVVGTANITLTFSEVMYTGAGSFTIRKTDDNSIVETIAASGPRVTGSGTSTITIDPVATLANGTGFYLTFSRTALADADGVIAGHLDADLRVRVPETTASFLSFITTGTLAVTLQHFTATSTAGTSLLKWETTAVINSLGFSVQHSSNGIDWITVGQVKPASNSSTVEHYQFVHTLPVKGNNYYRLVETGIDGKTTISETRLLKFGGAALVNLYPNPSKADVFLQFAEAAITSISVFSTNGMEVYKTKKDAALIKLSTAHLPAGLYQVVISREGEKITKTLIKE